MKARYYHIMFGLLAYSKQVAHIWIATATQHICFSIKPTPKITSSTFQKNLMGPIVPRKHLPNTPQPRMSCLEIEIFILENCLTLTFRTSALLSLWEEPTDGLIAAGSILLVINILELGFLLTVILNKDL